MNLDRMLDSCAREQWAIGDLDWSRAPRAMPREDEIAIVQLFTDMAGIERLAAALFREQQRRVEDRTLQAILASFVKDELRHAQVAQMLADVYDVHHYRHYEQSRSLVAFTRSFVDAIRYLADHVANAYVIVGELILDIAFLRSITDFANDHLTTQAMRFINRDEARHIAIDYHMAAYYNSDAYADRMAGRSERLSIGDRARAARTFLRMLYRAQPFIGDVILTPMNLVDPQGRRLREAFKRIQLLGRKEETARQPFTRFLRLLQDGVAHPVAGRVLGNLFGRITGVGKENMACHFSQSELAAARRMSYDDLAQEALTAKEFG